MKKILVLLFSGLLLVTLVACKDKVENERPVFLFEGLKDTVVPRGGTFDSMAGVRATDKEDGEITDDIELKSGSVDVNTVGEYTLTYVVKDSKGEEITAKRVVKVIDATLAGGADGAEYNFAYADFDTRNEIMSVLEKAALDNMYGGVPLFTNSGNVMFSSRLKLPVDNPVPVMDYANEQGTFTQDDSKVTMVDGKAGNVGEYTYRRALTSDAASLNPWKYEDSNENVILSKMYNSLYRATLNSSKTSYEYLPQMAASKPTIVGGEDEIGKVWEVKLRTDLEWNYNSNTDTNGFDHVINATDFIDSYKIGLDEGWKRAISGGGDLVSGNAALENAQCYVDSNKDDYEGTKCTFDQVGVKAIDDHTIHYTFKEDMTQWDVIYALGSYTIGPVHKELFDKLGDQYGTKPENVAYSGEYILDVWQDDNVLEYSKNDKASYFDYQNNFTHYSIKIIKTTETMFNEFIAGKLDHVSVPAAELDNYKSDPRLKVVPGATTFRMVVNGLGTATEQNEKFPSSGYTPEAIVANEDFKQAMYYVIDRKAMTEAMKSGGTPMQTLFSHAYVVDAVDGTPYRDTDFAENVTEGKSPATTGFNRDAAKIYFEKALDELIARGHYKEGTEKNPTIIPLEMLVFNSSQAQTSMGSYLKTAFDNTFVDNERHIKVELTIVPTAFPAIYYDYMMTGKFDLSIAGISGSTLDAASFLDIFTSDNRSSFTLSWGIDTSLPVVEYDGMLWSYDALQAALNEPTMVKNGLEVKD